MEEEAIEARPRLGRQDKWSDVAKAKLFFLWESGWSLEGIARRMRRSPLACYRKARAGGLPTGCPPGYEYFTASARRTGFAEKTLRRVLSFGNVKVHQALSDPLYVGKGCFTRQFVDPDAVDRAVAKWVASEPIAVAARRLGMSSDTLRRWLRAAGAIEEAKRRHRFHQRVDSALIDRLAAEHRERAPLAIADKKRHAALVRWRGSDYVERGAA